jgi:hypothetical protein
MTYTFSFWYQWIIIVSLLEIVKIVNMLSGCELIDTENISLLSQNMKFVGE